MSEQFDLIVLGGGRASALAIAAAKAGQKVALIEKDKLGGACPNRGCVPSKLLIGFAEAARNVRHADRHFTDATYRGIDAKAVFESVNEWIAGVDGRYEGRVEASGAILIRGEGRFVGEKAVQAGGRTLTADKIVVATGSHPTPPPFAELPVWTSDDLFPLKEDPPKSLIVIGSRFIGTEMSAFFSGIGIETKLFARGPRLLGRADSDIEATFSKEFTKEVETHAGASLIDLKYEESRLFATFEINGRQEVHAADKVLFAIGRRPNTASLNLEATGLAGNERGFLPVNDQLETSVPGIYAAGDVNGRYMLQHAASYEIQYLREKLVKGKTEPIDERIIAHAIFSHPEVASVGFIEEDLKAAGTDYVAVHQDWLASARAMASRLDYPRIKLLVSPHDYSILGCHLIGPEASTLMHQVLMLMHLKNDVRELVNMIYIHPGLNELFLSAAVSALGKVRKFKVN
ncbi:FAD-dependent oxidoreductase [Akkermansiaceae bacterium]|nr:FAD-dependent oxidoreductase [Akkermansiaceae bacterium]